MTIIIVMNMREGHITMTNTVKNWPVGDLHRSFAWILKGQHKVSFIGNDKLWIVIDRVDLRAKQHNALCVPSASYRLPYVDQLDEDEAIYSPGIVQSICTNSINGMCPAVKVTLIQFQIKEETLNTFVINEHNSD